MVIVAIHDANILIDMVKIGLADLLFQINIDMRTTDFVWQEIDALQQMVLQPFIDNGVLGIERFNAVEVLEIAFSARKYSGVSFEDCSLLAAAKREEAMIITGDRKLRKVIEQEKIEVHGCLWLFDQLVESGLTTPSVAAQKLKELQGINVRLPVQEVANRIKQWL